LANGLRQSGFATSPQQGGGRIKVDSPGDAQARLIQDITDMSAPGSCLAGIFRAARFPQRDDANHRRRLRGLGLNVDFGNLYFGRPRRCRVELQAREDVAGDQQGSLSRHGYRREGEQAPSWPCDCQLWVGTSSSLTPLAGAQRVDGPGDEHAALTVAVVAKSMALLRTSSPALSSESVSRMAAAIPTPIANTSAPRRQ
jgi:hypothetical protein